MYLVWGLCMYTVMALGPFWNTRDLPEYSRTQRRTRNDYFVARASFRHMCVCVCIYIYIYIYLFMYFLIHTIYVYIRIYCIQRGRERERERERVDIHCRDL